MPGSVIVISNSKLATAARCKRRFFYQYLAKPPLPVKTDYARLAGVEIHRHIRQLERPSKDERPFYYRRKIAAIRAWFNRWQRALAENAEKLIVKDGVKAEEYGKIGAICVANYWEANIRRQRPIAEKIERPYRYPYPFKSGVELVGIPDQVRKVSPEWILSHRPELFSDGLLRDDYVPEVIVDIKTGYLSFDAKRLKEDPTLEERVRQQYQLHEGTQATLFIWLYEKIHGKKPVAFCWYHLRSNKIFVTRREEEDYSNLFQRIDDLLETMNSSSFPKEEGPQCAWCDFIEPCQGIRPFILSEAEELPDTPGELLRVPNIVEEPRQKQLRLKLKGTRMKRPAPAMAPAGATADPKKPIILPDGPWEDETREPETAGKEAEPRD